MPVGNEYRNGLRFFCFGFFYLINFFLVLQICMASAKSDAARLYIQGRSCLVTHVGFNFFVRNLKIGYWVACFINFQNKTMNFHIQQGV